MAGIFRYQLAAVLLAVCVCFYTVHASAEEGPRVLTSQAEFADPADKQIALIYYGLYFSVKVCQQQGYAFTTDDVQAIQDRVSPIVAEVPQAVKDEVWTLLIQATEGKATTNDECLTFRQTGLEQLLPGALAPLVPDRSIPAPF